MLSAAIGILGGYFTLDELSDRYGTGYEQLKDSNLLLRKCSDRLAMINPTVIGDLKAFKDRIKLIMMFSLLILVLDVFRSFMTFIYIFST